MTRDSDHETALDTAIREAAREMTSVAPPDLRLRVAARLAEQSRWNGDWIPAFAAVVLVVFLGAWWVNERDSSSRAIQTNRIEAPLVPPATNSQRERTAASESGGVSRVVRLPATAPRRVAHAATTVPIGGLPPLEVEKLEIETIDLDRPPVEPIAIEAIRVESLSVEPLDSVAFPDPSPRRQQ